MCRSFSVPGRRSFLPRVSLFRFGSFVVIVVAMKETKPSAFDVNVNYLEFSFQPIARSTDQHRAPDPDTIYRSQAASYSVSFSIAQVYPTYLWAEEDLDLLNGSPVIAATESMRRKLESEYATVEKDLLDKFPKVHLVVAVVVVVVVVVVLAAVAAVASVAVASAAVDTRKIIK